MSDGGITLGSLLPWKREWVCKIAGFTGRGAVCVPEDPHDADDFGCGWRMTVSMLEEDYDSIKDAVVSGVADTPLHRFVREMQAHIQGFENERAAIRAEAYVGRMHRFYILVGGEITSAQAEALVVKCDGDAAIETTNADMPFGSRQHRIHFTMCRPAALEAVREAMELTNSVGIRVAGFQMDPGD